MSDVMEKIKSGRQYRSMKVEIRDANSEEKNYIVKGYATTFDEEYDLYEDDDVIVREKVDAKAFDEADMEDVIFQYNHEGRVFARTRNKTLNYKTDKHGLYIEADLSGTEAGRALYEEIAGGYTDRMSFGFTVTSDDVEERRMKGQKTVYVRTIRAIGKLYDVSAVSIPANDGTEISARSLVDGLIEKDKAERLVEAAEEKRKADKEELRKLLKKLQEV